MFRLGLPLLCALAVIAYSGCATVPNAGDAHRAPEYPNLFHDLLGRSEGEVEARLDSAFASLFHGDDSTCRVYYPSSDGAAAIVDILHNDVRTEGMSYGMMIALQRDKQAEFNALWRWAKTRMQFQSGPRRTFFAWQCTPTGRILDSSTASDGEEWIVMALLFAAHRWGNGGGIFDYQHEAQAILDAMLHKAEEPTNDGSITPIFNRRNHQVVFVPNVEASVFTDPSYHLPHFYQLWGRWAARDNAFWMAAADSSRTFLKRTVHPVTGLAPDYAEFDGTPVSRWGGSQQNFQYDAWRVAMNVGVDYAWFHADPWEVDQSNRLLRFFALKGVTTHGAVFTREGRQLVGNHSTGLVAMNAVAALAATDPVRKEFVEHLWNTPVPTGPGRYYDGLLYMLGMLQVSGNFRIYAPAGDGRSPD